MSRFQGVFLPLDALVGHGIQNLPRSARGLASSAAAAASKTSIRRGHDARRAVTTSPKPNPEQQQSYATASAMTEDSSIKIPYPFTTGHHLPPNRTFQAPTSFEIQANLPSSPRPTSSQSRKPGANKTARPTLHLGTVTKIGTMTSTVQISAHRQSFDKWFKRHTQHTVHIRAHEPYGYLHKGDMVEFARFSPATMAERYESGKLNRRGGGVRYEVHRVVTPFGPERVEEREQRPAEGEVGDRFGSVEYERRKVELTKPWNRVTDAGIGMKRSVGIIHAMAEAVQIEVESLEGKIGNLTSALGMDMQNGESDSSAARKVYTTAADDASKDQEPSPAGAPH